jgi:pyridoxamine 5'-phosphate oxidase
MSAPEDIRTARLDYARGTLDEASAARDPFEQFRAWLDDALAAALIEPNAMTLATVDGDGRPSARVVLLRGFDRRGFTFFTNYESRKGRELDAHHWATLLFWWGALERQVHIEGRAERVDAETSTHTSGCGRAVTS